MWYMKLLNSLELAHEIKLIRFILQGYTEQGYTEQKKKIL